MREEIGERIVRAARGWLGTPYRHQASRRGVGCDCLGLVRGVWREVYGHEPEMPPPYAPDWNETAEDDRLLAAAARHCIPRTPPFRVAAGDLLVFRWRPARPAGHLGIASEPHRFIHAYEQAAVVESALVPSWRRRLAGVFRFPGVLSFPEED